MNGGGEDDCSDEDFEFDFAEMTVDDGIQIRPIMREILGIPGHGKPKSFRSSL